MTFAPKPPGDRPEDWIAAAVGLTPQREERPGYFGAVGQNAGDVLQDWLPEWLPSDLRQRAGIATNVTPGLAGLVQAAALTGGALTAGRQEVLRPAAGALMGGTNVAWNRYRDLLGKGRLLEEPTDWSRQGLAQFSEEEAKRFGWGGEFLEGMITDPLTYVPVGGAGRRLAGAGEALAARGTLGAVAGAPLQLAGEAGRLYGEITDLPVRALGRGIQEGVKRTPVLRDVFGTSLQGQVSREVGRVGRSLNELLNLSRSKVDQLGNVSPVRQSFEEFTSPKELPLPAGVAQWGALRNMIQSIGDRITKFDSPYRQGLAIQLVDDVVDRKNWFEAEAAARRQGLREELAAGQITPQEAADLTDETFTYQGRNVAALYQATLEALDHLEVQEYPAVAPAIAGEIKERVRVGLQRMHDEALTKRDMDMYLDPADPKKVLFRRKDPEELEVLEAARDTLYRESRTAQRAYLSDVLDRIDELMGAPDEDTSGLMGAVTESWRERVGELGQFARPPRERLGVMSQEGTDILRDQLPALERSQRRWVLVRERVKANALPILTRHYRDLGQTAEAAAKSAAGDLVSREALLKKLDELDKVRTLPGPWEEVGRIRRDLDRHRGLDPLKPSDSFNLTMHEFAEKYALARGLKAPAPWLNSFFTATGIWRDLALLSPRFNEANLLWGLFSGQMDDVQAMKVMRTLGRNFQDVNRQMADGKGIWGWVKAAVEERAYQPRYQADLVPELRKLGLTDDQDNWLMPYQVAKSIDALQSIGRGQNEVATTAGGGVVSRIPHAGWSAGTAGLLGVTAYNEADDLEGEERLNHALRAAGVGAVAGLGVRPLVWGNRLLTKSIESALRTEAVVQGMLKALPGEREALIRKVLEAAPLEQPTIGKPVTVGRDLLGRVPVTRMRHLTSAFSDPPETPPTVDPAEVARARTAWITRDEGREAVDDALDVGEDPSTVLPRGDVRLMRPDEIVADPARFQFKSDVEAKTGAGKALSGVTSWETDSEGVILVWDDPADGRTYVVDGHHRLAKARELGVGEILTRRINAATAEEARARGALSNLRTENATATDAAKVMRQYGWGKEELRQQGVPLKKDLVMQALALRDLDDGLFQRVTLGEITPEVGAALATASPDPSGQRALLELVTGESAKGREITPRLIETLGRQVRNAGTVTMAAEGTEGLANTALFDLVGGTSTTKSLALDKATATEIVRREIADEARRFGTLSQARTVERAGEVAGQVLQPEENAARAAAAATAVADFDRALDNPLATGVQGVLDDLARSLASRRKKVLSRQEIVAAAGRVKEALVGDQGALSSRNAWEAATTRAPAAAAAVEAAPTGMEDMFGGAVEEAAEVVPAAAAVTLELQPGWAKALDEARQEPDIAAERLRRDQLAYRVSALEHTKPRDPRTLALRQEYNEAVRAYEARLRERAEAGLPEAARTAAPLSEVEAGIERRRQEMPRSAEAMAAEEAPAPAAGGVLPQQEAWQSLDDARVALGEARRAVRQGANRGAGDAEMAQLRARLDAAQAAENAALTEATDASRRREAAAPAVAEEAAPATPLADAVLSREAARTRLAEIRQTRSDARLEIMQGFRRGDSEETLAPLRARLDELDAAEDAANREYTSAARQVVGEAVEERPPIAGTRVFGEAPDRPTARTISGPETVAAVNAMNLPDHVKDTLRQNVEQAARLGLLEKIEALAAEELTVRTAGARLLSESPRTGVDPSEFYDMTRSVRTALGIPSMDEPAEFATWLADYRARKGGAAAPAAPEAPAAATDDAARQAGFKDAAELEAEQALLARTPRLAQHSYDTLLSIKQAVGDRLRAMKAHPATDPAQIAKDERLLADLTAHRDARLAAWEHARGEAARTEVAGTGKLTMTRQEMGRATANQGDVYVEARLGKETKGFSSSGEEILGYPYQPDLFIKSDLSGKMVRHYVTLPDGRIAHPDEIYEAQQRGNIIIADTPSHIPDDYRGYRSRTVAETVASTRSTPSAPSTGDWRLATSPSYAEPAPTEGTPAVAPLLTTTAGAAEARPPAPPSIAPPGGPPEEPPRWPPNAPLGPDPLEVARPDRVRPGMLRIGMSEPSPVLRYEMTPEQKEGIVAFIEREQHFSQTELAQEALRLGVRPQMADAVGRDWANGIRGAEDAGMSQNDRINYDYSDVSNATEALRNLGIFPFATWAIKTAPRVMHWLLQDPRFFIAIDRLNQVSQSDIQESGLSPSYSRLVGLGPLGDAIAEHLLGRPDASVLGQPWAMFMPFTEVGRPSRTQEDAGLIEKALDVGGTFGASLGPLPSLAARLTGQTSEYGGSVLRTSPYLEALTLAATGRPVDPEAGLKRGIRGVREVLGAEDEPTLTGSPIKDYAIRQRIAELAIERTSKPAAGEYLLAMDMPTHPLFQEAERTVNRQMAGQTTAAAVLPFRTKALSDTAEAIGWARLRQGIAPADLAAVPKEDRAAMWKRAERAEPLVGGFSSTGGDERGVLARQFQQWALVKRKTQRLNPSARAKARAEFLDQHQVLQEFLAKHPIY